MTKKILISLGIIGIVAAVTVGLTTAYFSDTETSTGNTFTAGTIDISVDGSNPWEVTEAYSLVDMKPCYTDYIDFVIYNEGNNPANIWKILDGYLMEDNLQSEPECIAGSGTWNNSAKKCAGSYTQKNDIDTVINYDLRVELYDKDPSQGADPVWWETIYLDSDDATLDSLEELEMYLGMVPSNWWMVVKQSYHMVDTAENWAQGDKLTFDITLRARQLTNTVLLENKYLSNTDVSHHVWNSGGISDGKDATLTYKVKDREFAYELDINGMPAGDYTLIAWEDPSYVWDWDSRSGIVLAQVDTSSETHFEDSVELSQDLVNSKLWLVPGDHGNPADTGVVWPWDPAGTLFETGLIDYYDAD